MLVCFDSLAKIQIQQIAKEKTRIYTHGSLLVIVPNSNH